jgi:ligand-binding SRPBCC domain-containing protein
VPGTVALIEPMKLRFEQHVAAPRERLFAFHTTPENLARLLEGWRGFALLEHDGHIRPGARVRLEQRAAFMRHELVFEHFLLEPPQRFAERQKRGPFRRFEHLHEFFEAAGGSRIVDTLDFELPWFLGGVLAEHLVAKRVLTRFFEFRRAAYRRLCDSGCFAASK